MSIYGFVPATLVSAVMECCIVFYRCRCDAANIALDNFVTIFTNYADMPMECPAVLGILTGGMGIGKASKLNTSTTDGPGLPLKWISRIAWATLVWHIVTILAGTVVRATGSGDGCGSHWPLCNGEVMPLAPTIKTIIEITHRRISAFDGLLVLLTVGLVGFRFRFKHTATHAALVMLVLTGFEAWIGKYIVNAGLVADNKSMFRAIWMSLHLVNTFLLLTSSAITAWCASNRPALRLRGQGPVLATILLTFVTMIVLGISGAITALGDTLYPAQSHQEVMRLAQADDAPAILRLRILHPYIALSAGCFVVIVAAMIRHLRPSRDTAKWSNFVVWLFVLQTAVGGLNVWLKAPLVMQVLHLLMADAVWISMVFLSAGALSADVVHLEDKDFAPAVAPGAAAVLPATWKDYLALTKPRVISLLLLTTMTAMFVAAKGWPGLGVFIAVFVGGFLSAGAANALNMVIDRDIDARMERTKHRPTVTSVIPGRNAFAFAMSLAVMSFLVLWLGANLVAATASLGGLAFYVVVYTLFLKRRTTQNIVIGGAAGCFPPLVGWAAVTGDLGGALAWYLFAIIFVWTPAHFWALALMIKDEYARVGVPMLPSVAGDKATAIQIVVYAVLTVVVSLIPWFQGLVGLIYAIAAIILGLLLVGRSGILIQNTSRPSAKSAYLFSMLYLALLFVAMAIDRSVLS